MILTEDQEKAVEKIKAWLKTINFIGKDGKAFFFGDNVRGAIVGVRQ